jgi:K+-sensing histidine kinase KdpD
MRQKWESFYKGKLRSYRRLFTIGNSSKKIIIVLLILLCVVMTYYFQWKLGIQVVFTHVYYLPIVIAGIWWAMKGAWISIFLAALLIVSHFLSGLDTRYGEDLLRALMFIVVGLMVGSLSEESRRRAKALELSQKETEQVFNTAASGVRVIDKDFNVLRVNDKNYRE